MYRMFQRHRVFSTLKMESISYMYSMVPYFDSVYVSLFSYIGHILVGIVCQCHFFLQGEIGRRSGGDNVLEREGYAVSAGFSLGLVLLGMSSRHYY
jgi:hypothetical protein